MLSELLEFRNVERMTIPLRDIKLQHHLNKNNLKFQLFIPLDSTANCVKFSN